MTTTLEAITTNFRRFTKNQVLTEGHLNQIVDYFDDQIRLSRTCLSGVGIVCGFEVSLDEVSNEITITQGVGVTTDGDLMNLYQEREDEALTIDFESITYTGYRGYDNTQADYRPFFYKNNNQITLRELTMESSGEGIRPLSNLTTLSDMVVLLYLETYIEETDLCTTLGCDNQGENRVANQRVLLVSKSDAEYIISQDQTIQKTNYGKLYYDLPEIVMNKVVATPDVFDSYDDIKTSFAEAIFKDDVWSTLKEGYTTLLSALEATDLLADVTAKFDEIFDFELSNIPDDFQYRYDLLKDLVDTYNEIKELLLNIDVSDCCAGYEDFPKHLMLGEVQRDGECYECRHEFYKSPILANTTANTCNSCSPVELDYQLGGSNDDALGCEDGLDPDGNLSQHIAFVIDESGSYSAQRELVRGALRGYVNSVATTNIYISFIGMSSSFDGVRTDHVIYARADDPRLNTWLDNYATGASQGNSSSDYWGAGFRTVIDSILNVDQIPDPAIVIVIADEESGIGSASESPAPTISLLNAIKSQTKFFAYLIDNSPADQSFTGNAARIIPNAVPSLDGESDLDRSDYFLTDTFTDLDVKIRNLNESLISSNIFCPETTEDEIIAADADITICYSSDRSEQKLFSLTRRAAQQIINYNPAYNFIKITPSMELGVLSKKAIPFYYNVGEKLIEYWDFDKTVLGTHRTNLSYHDSLLAIKKPLEFCIDHDFYRVEGHLGRNYLEVVDRINTIKKSNSLGFNVVALPIERFNTIGEDYKAYYLSKNYGLEHKAGVPEGGTLVLFYLENQDVEDERDEPIAGRSLIDDDTINPVIADFCLPYLCCDESEVDACLPEEIICFDENTQPIPFEVTPRDAEVRDDVPLGLKGGVIRNSDGSYSFDPRRVSRELHSMRLKFMVNNQRSRFSVRIFEKAEVTVDRSVVYDIQRTVATVTFTVSGSDVNLIDRYYWDFDDGSPISNVRPNSAGQVIKTYSLPVNSANTVFPKLAVVNGLCETEVPIESIEFDDRPYYYNGISRRILATDTDSILSISIGEL